MITHKWKVYFRAKGATTWQEVDGHFTTPDSVRSFIAGSMVVTSYRPLEFDVKRITERTGKHVVESKVSQG